MRIAYFERFQQLTSVRHERRLGLFCQSADDLDGLIWVDMKTVEDHGPLFVDNDFPGSAP